MAGWWTTVVSLLALAGGGEPAPEAPVGPGSPADVCAIAARPESPGFDSVGEAEASARAYRIDSTTDWRIGGWDPRTVIRPEWGPCPVDHVRFTSLWFSPDGRYARTEGSWRAGPLEGGEGYCVFEKKGKAWDVVACTITAIS